MHEPTHPPASPRARRLRWLEAALWLAGAAILVGVLAGWLDGRLYQLRESRRLEQVLAAAAPAGGATGLQELPGEDPPEESTATDAGTLRSNAASATPSTPEAAPVPRRASPAPLPLEVLGRLAIPRLDLETIVAHGVDRRTLRRAVGHIPGTALPGRPGNVALAGHRDDHFRPLEGVAPGDEITLTTPEGTFRYAVEWTRVVDPSEVSVIRRTPEPALTLVTCYPFRYVGSAPQRFIVRARQLAAEPVTAKQGPDAPREISPPLS